MPRLTDTQAILLTHAAQHKAGSFIPLPESLIGEEARERVAKAFAQLLNRTLAVERETSDVANVHRTDGDIRYGLFITATGLAAVGIEDGADEATAADTKPAAASRATKSAAVLTLLQRDGGATLAELIETTGWLPHTTRAALTGLRKKGHAVERSKRDGATCYRVAA